MKYDIDNLNESELIELNHRVVARGQHAEQNVLVFRKEDPSRR